jgi:hypothetical protein
VRLGSVDDAARYAEKWFVPLVRGVTGFVAYYLMTAEPGVLATVGVFETKEAADTAGRVAHEWFGQEWGAFRPLPPEVIAGEVVAPAVNPWLHSGRRWMADRRRATLVPASERADAERRSGSDRRRGFDRRTDFVPLFERRAAG